MARPGSARPGYLWQAEAPTKPAARKQSGAGRVFGKPLGGGGYAALLLQAGQQGGMDADSDPPPPHPPDSEMAFFFTCVSGRTPIRAHDRLVALEDVPTKPPLEQLTTDCNATQGPEDLD